MAQQTNNNSPTNKCYYDNKNLIINHDDDLFLVHPATNIGTSLFTFLDECASNAIYSSIYVEFVANTFAVFVNRLAIYQLNASGLDTVFDGFSDYFDINVEAVLTSLTDDTLHECVYDK